MHRPQDVHPSSPSISHEKERSDLRCPTGEGHATSDQRCSFEVPPICVSRVEPFCSREGELTAQEASADGARNACAVDGQHRRAPPGRIGIPAPVPSLCLGKGWRDFGTVLRHSSSATSRTCCHRGPSTCRTCTCTWTGPRGLSSHSTQHDTRGTPCKSTRSAPNHGLPSRLVGPVPIVWVTIPRVRTL